VPYFFPDTSASSRRYAPLLPRFFSCSYCNEMLLPFPWDILITVYLWFCGRWKLNKFQLSAQLLSENCFILNHGRVKLDFFGYNSLLFKTIFELILQIVAWGSLRSCWLDCSWSQMMN
jgi:hypothetical protein